MRKASRIRGNLLYDNNTSLGDLHSKFVLATTQTLHISSFPHHRREISSHDEKQQRVPTVDDTGTSGLVLRHTQYTELLSMLAFGVHVACLNWLSQIWNLVLNSEITVTKIKRAKNFHSTDSKNDEHVSSKDGLAASPVFRILEDCYLLPYWPKQSLKRLVNAEGNSKCAGGKHGSYKFRSCSLPSEIGKCGSQ